MADEEPRIIIDSSWKNGGAIDNLKNHPFVVQLLAENTAISKITLESDTTGR